MSAVPIEEVAPTYDRMKADPSRSIPAEKVFAAIRGRHEKRPREKNVI
jgi:antitoxin ParD1/3/4